MYQWLSEAACKNCTVITANRRLARILKSEFAKQQLASGKQAWLSPDIRFLDDWLSSIVNTAATDAMPIVLSKQASSIVWERCLRELAGDALLNVGGLVRQAMQSWKRLHDWRVPLDEVSRSAHSDDERLFASAARSYQKILAASNWTDGAQIPGLAAEHVAGGAVNVPDSIVHAGFDRISPAIEHLIANLEQRGCVVSPAADGEGVAQVEVVAFDDKQAELRTAGAWARGELTDDAEGKVGIIYLALDKQSAAAERYVREGIAPGWQYGNENLDAAVNTSYGRRLSEYPAIAVALLALRWVHSGLSFREISPLLRSGFIAGDNAGGRCTLELYLRSLPDQSWSPKDIIRVFKDRATEPDAIGWLECIEQIGALQAHASRESAPVQWAQSIDQLMSALKWPGTETLASRDFQLLNRWRELLNEFAQLEIVCPSLTLSEAIRSLTTLANNTLFQPESESSAVQLLGPLEAAGMRFDALWVAGLDGDAWPPVAHPLALVSRHIQTTYCMPDASPDDTLEYSRRVLARLVNSASRIRLSWATSAEEADKTASPLLAGFRLSADREPTDPGWHATGFIGSCSLDQTDSDSAPAVQPGETITGGAYTVQRQATNPFSAFAFGRLGIRELESVATGLSPRMRGSILHKALHELYADRPSQAEIQGWIDGDIKVRINRASEAALKKYRRHADPVLHRILDFEHERLCRLLYDFVGREMERSAFQVASVEQDIEYRDSGVELNIRPDRVDRLGDGTLLVADYKSGSRKNLLDVSGDMKDLQLAVYASALDANIGALALINIGSQSIVYDSAGGSEEWDAKRAEHWPERLCAWCDRVARATKQIALGDARINLSLKTIEARPLNILCRFEERRHG